MARIKLLLLESVLPERSSSDIGLLIDLEMLIAVGGKSAPAGPISTIECVP